MPAAQKAEKISDNKSYLKNDATRRTLINRTILKKIPKETTKIFGQYWT
jgi:hypothetical protein